jgi:hypothetical protein
MASLHTFDDQLYEAALQPLWRYLGVFDEPTQSDVIFVFGGLDLAVPRRAAELYSQGYAPTVVLSGAAGPLTRHVFASTEAEVFRDEMLKCGMPNEAILLDTRATNTLENVRFGMAVLAEHGIHPSTAVLVGKTFLMRRCRATFGKQHPEVIVRCCPPRIPVMAAVDRDRAEFAARLLAELRRLEEYARKGDIAPQPDDPEVAFAATQLQSLLAASS